MFTTKARQSEAIPQSFNRYSYTQNDPVNFTDPSGLDPDDEIFDPGEIIRIDTWTSRWPTIPINLGTGFPAYDLMPDPESLGGGETPQNPAPPAPTPMQPQIPTIEALREKVKRECLARKKAEADRDRAKYITGSDRRMLKGMAVRAGIGALRGAYAGAVGGAFGAGVGAIPGAIGGAVVGGIFGAGSSAITGALIREPAQRAFYDRTTYQPALDRAVVECDIEADRVR